MKVTNSEIWAAKEPLDKLLQVKLPVKTSYQIARLVRKITEEYLVIEPVRIGLVKKYGKADDKGNISIFTAPQEDQEKFVVEYNELMGQEVEIVVDKITISAGQADKLELEPAIFLPLDKFIVVGD